MNDHNEELGCKETMLKSSIKWKYDVKFKIKTRDNERVHTELHSWNIAQTVAFQKCRSWIGQIQPESQAQRLHLNSLSLTWNLTFSALPYQHWIYLKSFKWGAFHKNTISTAANMHLMSYIGKCIGLKSICQQTKCLRISTLGNSKTFYKN